MLLALVVKVMANHFGVWDKETLETFAKRSGHQWVTTVDKAFVTWHYSTMSQSFYGALTVEREAMATIITKEDTY